MTPAIAQRAPQSPEILPMTIVSLHAAKTHFFRLVDRLRRASAHDQPKGGGDRACGCPVGIQVRDCSGNLPMPCGD